MSYDQDIANIQARIKKADSDQDTWRASGNQEKYLESYSMVDALEIELDLLRKQRLEAGARAERFRAIDPPPAAKARGTRHDAHEQERLMAEYSITPSGRQYQYSKYRYDRFEDALGYARKQRLAPSACDAGDSLPPARVMEAQDDAQRRQMAAHRITFDEGVYHLGSYRYDRLADAVDYAGVQELAEAFPGSIRNPTPRASLS